MPHSPSPKDASREEKKITARASKNQMVGASRAKKKLKVFRRPGRKKKKPSQARQREDNLHWLSVFGIKADGSMDEPHIQSKALWTASLATFFLHLIIKLSKMNSFVIVSWGVFGHSWELKKKSENQKKNAKNAKSDKILWKKMSFRCWDVHAVGLQFDFDFSSVVCGLRLGGRCQRWSPRWLQLQPTTVIRWRLFGRRILFRRRWSFSCQQRRKLPAGSHRWKHPRRFDRRSSTLGSDSSNLVAWRGPERRRWKRRKRWRTSPKLSIRSSSTTVRTTSAATIPRRRHRLGEHHPSHPSRSVPLSITIRWRIISRRIPIRTIKFRRKRTQLKLRSSRSTSILKLRRTILLSSLISLLPSKNLTIIQNPLHTNIDTGQDFVG